MSKKVAEEQLVKQYEERLYELSKANKGLLYQILVLKRDIEIIDKDLQMLNEEIALKEDTLRDLKPVIYSLDIKKEQMGRTIVAANEEFENLKQTQELELSEMRHVCDEIQQKIDAARAQQAEAEQRLQERIQTQRQELKAAELSRQEQLHQERQKLNKITTAFASEFTVLTENLQKARSEATEAKSRLNAQALELKMLQQQQQLTASQLHTLQTEERKLEEILNRPVERPASRIFHRLQDGAVVQIRPEAVPYIEQSKELVATNQKYKEELATLLGELKRLKVQTAEKEKTMNDIVQKKNRAELRLAELHEENKRLQEQVLQNSHYQKLKQLRQVNQNLRQQIEQLQRRQLVKKPIAVSPMNLSKSALLTMSPKQKLTDMKAKQPSRLNPGYQSAQELEKAKKRFAMNVEGGQAAEQVIQELVAQNQRLQQQLNDDSFRRAEQIRVSLGARARSLK